MMKKIISLFLVSLMVFLCAVPALAQEEERMIDAGSFRFTFMPRINGEYRNLISHDYYKLYYNDLLEQEYEAVNLWEQEFLDFSENQLLSALTDGTYTYASLLLTEDENTQDYTAYNTAVLREFFTEEEILYVADRVPMAVVKLSSSKKEDVKNSGNIVCILEAFFRLNRLLEPLEGFTVLGNVQDSPANAAAQATAADARKILRVSANLEKPTADNAKQFYFCADMNLDGHITAEDARLALRTAIGLEESVSIGYSYTAYWNDFQIL